MSDLQLQGLRKTYGTNVAVENLSLDVRDGEMVAFLGPSGCGKTTTLRMVAGFVSPTAGTIRVGGADITDLPPNRRDMGMVFQSYALFPHKTVFDNVAFGLKYRNVPKADIARKVGQALAMVRLPGSEKKLPSQLSGGQQQRIALARAIVFEPEVLLLDEPLSALDANMREEMRVEIKKIQKATGITALFVTHDQEEALSMSDRIVVMNAGSMEQIGTPQEVYETPATAFVADFLGKANMLPGTVATADGVRAKVALAAGQSVEVVSPRPLSQGTAVTVVVRPQKLFVGSATAGNRLSGRVVSTSYLGGSAIYEIDLGDKTIVRANNAIAGPLAHEGETVELGFDPRGCVLLDGKGLRIA